MTVSPFAEQVVELLGELFGGLYHLDSRSIDRADWSDDRYIEVSFYSGGMSTFDFDDLTRLVFLAHHLAIRVCIKPCNMRYLRLAFTRRSRAGDLFQRHPDLDEAVANFKATVNLPEAGTQDKPCFSADDLDSDAEMLLGWAQ